jgi:hypothetical protein
MLGPAAAAAAAAAATVDDTLSGHGCMFTVSAIQNHTDRRGFTAIRPMGSYVKSQGQ